MLCYNCSSALLQVLRDNAQHYTLRLPFREGASSRIEFAENIHGGFLTPVYVKLLLRSKLLATLRSVCGLLIETVVLICRNCLTPGGAEICFII